MSYLRIKGKAHEFKQGIELNSNTFQEDLQKHQTELMSDDTTIERKWDLCVFYGSKVTSYIHIKPDLVSLLANIIWEYFVQDIKFLSFQNTNVVIQVCEKIIRNECHIKGNERFYICILKFLLRYTHDEEIRTIVFNELMDLFVQTRNINIRMIIADVMLLNGFETVGEQLLQRIRLMEQPTVTNRRNITNDTQNVHNSEINSSVLQCSVRLIELYQSNELKSDEILKELDNPLLGLVLERLETDTTLFHYEEEKSNVSFNLPTVLANTWQFIKMHENSSELKKILTEHLIDATNYCSTGYLARIISTIQGFSDDEKLQIRISPIERLKPIMKMRMDSIIRDMPQHILDNMIEVNNNVFTQYILDHLDLTEFAMEKPSHVLEILETYCQNDKLYWHENKIHIK
jgi:hypothetical protein